MAESITADEVKKRVKHFTNPEPKTWACECGQMNLLADRTCFSCAGDKDECWDPDDRQSQRGRF